MPPQNNHQQPVWPTTPNQPSVGNHPAMNAAGVNKPQKKGINFWAILSIIVMLLLIATVIFALWAYAGYQDYKNNTLEKVATAVAIAKKEESSQKDKEFVEKEKIPYKTYQTSDNLAGVKFDYPKTWSAFIAEDKETNSGTPLEAYLHPNVVPSTNSGTDFGTRVQIINKSYSDVVDQYEGKVKQGKLKIVPYKAEKVPSVLGVKIDGEINPGQINSMIVLPLRDKTLVMWTESVNYLNDFNNIVKSLNFTP